MIGLSDNEQIIFRNSNNNNGRTETTSNRSPGFRTKSLAPLRSVAKFSLTLRGSGFHPILMKGNAAIAISEDL